MAAANRHKDFNVFTGRRGNADDLETRVVLRGDFAAQLAHGVDAEDGVAIDGVGRCHACDPSLPASRHTATGTATRPAAGSVRLASVTGQPPRTVAASRAQ